MQTFSASPDRSAPLALSPSVQGQVYGLLAFAMALTLVGAYLGAQFGVLLSPGALIFLLVAELGLILTAGAWSRKSPLNYFLFGLFPLFSGFTLTPFLLGVTAGYVNGGSILVNALLATTCMVGAAAVAALATGWNLSAMGRMLFLGLIGLIVVGLLQIFVPSLRTGQAEMLISGAGVLIFAGFTAYDIQRVAAMARSGGNPFLLALSLYLDIYNLFLYVLRFMLAVAGRRD